MVGTTYKARILRTCPVCGKMPRVKQYDYPGWGAWVVIQCKPFLRKPHLKIEEGKASPDRAYEYAVLRWNKEANNG